MKLKILLVLLFTLFFSINITKSRNKAQFKIQLGIDNLIESGFDVLLGKKIALLTNFAGRTNSGKLTLDIFERTNSCYLVSVFTPEHGFYCSTPAGKKVYNDTINNLPVYSLYGNNRRPTKYQLSTCDAVVVDLQDIGIRSYTYISTLYKMMDACAEYGKELFVLDRPNPLSGLLVDGNTVDYGMESFVSIAPVSYIHGCTIGELADMINEEGWLPYGHDNKPRKCRLNIIKMSHWKRWMNWESTGLKWYPTSPNITSADAIRGAAMLGIFGELGRINLGINTNYPFQFLGFNKLKFSLIAQEFKTNNFPGIELTPTSYKTINHNYSGKEKGFFISFYPDTEFLPYTTGIKLILVVRKLYPEFYKESEISSKSKSMFIKVTGTKDLFDAITNGYDDTYVLRSASKGLNEFLEIRKKYLLY